MSTSGQDPVTPIRRNPGRQVRESVRSPSDTPPSKTRDYYTTPTRSTARVQQAAGSPIATTTTTTTTRVPNASQARVVTQQHRRSQAPRDLGHGNGIDGGPATRLKRPRRSINYDEGPTSDESSESSLSQHGNSSTDNDGPGDESDEHGNSRCHASSIRAEKAGQSREATSPPSSCFQTSPRRRGRPRKAPRLSSSQPSSREPPNQKTASDPAGLNEIIIPNWQGSLPHLVWVQILTYASAAPGPFYVDASWLLKAARVCKVMLDPAITVLYRNPPISTEFKMVGLITLLRRPPSRLLFNYRAKIRSLHLDVSVVSVASNTYGSPQNLIQNLPQLKEIAIVHPLDKPPYRSLNANIRWHYPEDLFRGLEVAEDASETLLDKTLPTRLRAWTWNERFLKSGTYVDGLATIRQIHLKQSFSTLRKLRFVNFQIPSFRADGASRKSEASLAVLETKDKEHAQLISDALAALPHLEHLAFESSTSANPTLLPLLPRNIKRLELINCWEISSDVFSSFLMSHGRALVSLLLNYNQALSLAFLTVLGQACPYLTDLRMNLLYYRHHEFLDDSDPFYDFLLVEDQIPTWPTKLQVIDMENLRGWSADAANMFFQSLVNSAGNLPDLRRLSIKAMINIPWRERSGIRQGWQDKLTKVFLRPYVAPARLTTIRSRAAEKPPTGRALAARLDKVPVAPSRRSSRLMAEIPHSSTHLSGKANDLRSINRVQYQEPESDGGTEGEFNHRAPSPTETPEFEVDLTTPKENKSELMPSRDPAIQGLCDIVDIVIDNQKPREQQFGMGDFLDEMDTSGAESDAEWDGR